MPNFKFFIFLNFCLTLSSCAPFQPGNEIKTQREFRSPFASGLQPPSASTTTPPIYHPSSTFNLKWPVNKINVSQSYRPKRNPSHEGIDFVQGYGAPIFAAHEGYVVYRGSQYRGYGRIVIIEYNRYWATLYGHLESIKVKEGQIIQAGEIIGSMGNTGRSSGPHLHFELLRNKVPVDPMPYLKFGSKYVTRK